MKQSFTITRSLFMLVILGWLLASCVPQKKIKYLQVKEEAQARTEFVNKEKKEYKIQPGDNLYIKIVSIDEKTSAMFNVYDTRTYGGSQSNAGIYLNSYTVNKNGYVDFPLIGSVLVKNMTVEEVKYALQKALDEYIKESVVIVKMVNFYITMLGEVQRPGEYQIYQDELNIFEAISMAGDLTDFANRNEVKLIRKTKEGSHVIDIDLTQQDILESQYFTMMPNDILYVAPLKGKQFAFANFPYGIVFSAISTVLLLINYFK